jgi:serine/threonine protein kinase/tetratricopeptide (TPR) repeat protein
MFFPTLDDTESALLDTFEHRLRLDPGANLSDFLPRPDHSNFSAVATELARVDMEYAWSRGSPRPPEHYFAAVPALRENPSAVAALAFEDYRIRKLGGEPVTPDVYAERFQVSVTGWPTDPSADREPPDPLGDCAATPPPAKRVDSLRIAIVNPPSGGDSAAANVVGWLGTQVIGPAAAVVAEAERSDPDVVRKWSAAVAALPDVGSHFLGFELLEELGRGAFGRVYLARQERLAGRRVALKVAHGLFTESQTLAQLQHTNVVPIYSMHDAGPVQAVCMPYFGRCTLAHVLADIQARGALPTTGEHLVSTVGQAKTVTRPEPRTVAVNPAPAGLIPVPDPDPRPAPVTPAAGDAGRKVWARLAALSYPDVIVWIGSELAGALAHAHERGILHRDLKPANVLLTDDGVPMLLDFNIAEDTKVRGRVLAAVGGTLPYMAPEQLRNYGGSPTPLDGRADVYALGVILFEMLTGGRPFPDHTGEQAAVIPRMLADRQADPPRIRTRNPHVPPSVESIVRTCLAADPAARYPSACALHDDLVRHLTDRPLAHAPEPSLRERVRKWARRHPRLTSVSSVVAAALVLVGLLAGGLLAARERSRVLEEQSRTLEARVVLADHARDLTALQELLDDRNQTRESLESGIALCRTSLDRYGIPADADDVPAGWDHSPLVRYLPDADQDRLRHDFGEVFYLMAKAGARRAEMAVDPADRGKYLEAAARWNRLAEGYGHDRIPRAVREQRADLAHLSGRPDEAARWSAEAARTPPGSPRDHYLLGYWHHHQGRYRQAAAELEAATAADPTSFSAWFVRGVNHLAMEQNDLAAMCFTACVALRADFAPVWRNRGIALARLKKFDLALTDYAAAARLTPDDPDVHVLRVGVFKAQNRHADAVEACSAALRCPGCPSRVYFYRAASREALGDKAGAAADEAEGLKREPTDELSWTARAEAKAAREDYRGALADVEQALRVNPRSADAMQMKAYLLSEKLDDPAGAIRVLDRAVELYPDSAPLRAGRGVLRARAGDRDGAIRDAEESLVRDSGGSNLYQVGCIYALTAKTHPADRFRAFELLTAALKTGFGADLLETDPDLDALRTYPEFQKLTPPR